MNGAAYLDQDVMLPPPRHSFSGLLPLDQSSLRQSMTTPAHSGYHSRAIGSVRTDHDDAHRRPRPASSSCRRTIAWSTIAHRHSRNNPRNSRHVVLNDRIHVCPPIVSSMSVTTPSENPEIAKIAVIVGLSIWQRAADSKRFTRARAKLRSVPS